MEYFLIENVPQFLSKERGRYLERVLSELSGEYHISYSVVNDHELGGYSIRKRAVIVGSCREMGKVVIPHIVLSDRKTVGDALKKVTPDWFNYEDITRSSEETMRNMAYVRPGHNYKDIPSMRNLDRHSNVYCRLSMDEPAVTMLISL